MKEQRKLFDIAPLMVGYYFIIGSFSKANLNTLYNSLPTVLKRNVTNVQPINAVALNGQANSLVVPYTLDVEELGNLSELCTMYKVDLKLLINCKIYRVETPNFATHMYIMGFLSNTVDPNHDLYSKVIHQDVTYLIK